ncbi:MAG: GNAT family N-acetyltransferase [Prochlorotrichaceae cyanobacterium]|jgi:ribosomal protein S18 acetylase RimI-like enzyme
MGFWKSLLSGSGANTLSSKDKGRTAQGGGIDHTSIEFLAQTDQKGTRLFFSMDRHLDLYELEELCHSVGWARRPLHKVRKALANSFMVVSLWEDREIKPRLIGFARATSDHAFNATVWDVAIRPAFQGRGLGKALMAYMVRKLRKQDISNITLFADPHVVEFYRQMGFVADPEGIKGMFWYPD